MQARFLIATIAALVMWGCGSSGSYSGNPTPNAPTPTSTATVVTIVGQKGDQSFTPNPAPVATGASVAWRNSDSTVHRIAMNDGSWDSGTIAAGATSQEMRLSGSGGNYHCTIHPSMVGSINVPTTAPPPGSSPYSNR